MKNRKCYYFDDRIKIEYFDLDNILIDEKSYENILVYSISYKSLIHSKLLRVRFDKIAWFVRVYDRNKYLVLFGIEKHNSIYSRIRYLISVNGGISYIISHISQIIFHYATIKVDSYDSLPLEKKITLRNVIVLIKSV